MPSRFEEPAFQGRGIGKKEGIVNPNYPIVTLIRDAKFQSPTEPAFYSTIITPDGTHVQGLDPGGVAEQTVEMYYLPSPHLTAVHYKHVNAQWLADNHVPEGEVESLVGEAVADAPNGAISHTYSRPNSPMPFVIVQFAYRGLHTKINDGSESENILMHGGNVITDSKDCFVLGMQRALVQDHQGLMEKGLIASQAAKTLFEEKMVYKPFNLTVSNGPGIQTSGATS
jgi:hypothetical protein